MRNEIEGIAWIASHSIRPIFGKDDPHWTSPVSLSLSLSLSSAQFADAMSLDAVSCKLPQLWMCRVRDWFAQAKNQFVTNKGVTASLMN